ncbi:response regulator [Thermodesulfobacteriota bacterium]
MHILIIDDEKTAIETLTRGLRVKGYSVTGVLTAASALALIDTQKDSIAMVITDYIMPDMDGMELLDEIRKRHKTLPVILVTAYASKQILVEAMRKKCSGFLEKPFTLEQLHSEIQRVAAEEGL